MTAHKELHSTRLRCPTMIEHEQSAYWRLSVTTETENDERYNSSKFASILLNSEAISLMDG